MRDYRPFVTFVVAALLPLTASSAVYKYIDENGRIAYSDTPVDGAETMKMQRAPTPAPDEVVEEKAASRDGDASDDAGKYKSLQVLNPTPGKVVNNSAGSVQIILLPTPALSESHEIIINVDGKDMTRGRSAALNLTNVNLGSHSVTGRIVDKDGYVVIESDTVTFHLRNSGEDDEVFQ